MFSIICVYNNEPVLKDFLLRSLDRQSAKYELILMDNTKREFTSAAQALNIGAERAAGEYLMFVHQDIALCTDTWLADIEQILSTLPGLGIAGVAGKPGVRAPVVTNITHGTPPRPAGSATCVQPLIVQTVDECLVIIPRSVFTNMPFDENTCNDWHLYAVDYCLTVEKMGLKTYVLPALAHHASTGKATSKYFETLQKLLAKHHSVPVICTTMGDWYTRWPRRPLQQLRIKVRR